MPKKILIVEDDMFLKSIMAQKLDKENFEVLEASDGKEGIEKIKSEKPDLVLLDLYMPETDGFQLLEEIKNSPDKEIRKIPIIITSNFSQEEDMKRTKELGAVDYMVKAHFTPEEIIEKARSFLE